MDKNEKIQQIKDNLYDIIFKTDTPAGKRFDVILLIAIVFSVFMAIIESVGYIREHFLQPIRIIEWAITVSFTIEYLTRIYCSPNRLRYIFSFYGIIDLLSILPSFIGIFISGTHYLVIIRSVRLLRIFRIFKLSHFVRESNTLAGALLRSLDKILVFMYFILIIVTILGSLMYVIEGSVNPSFSNIPKSIYWAIVTITTVGYGDITPITFLGQFLATIIMLLGYAIIAIPTGIISAEIIRPSHKKDNRVCTSCRESEHEPEARFCKHCGSSLPSV